MHLVGEFRARAGHADPAGFGHGVGVRDRATGPREHRRAGRGERLAVDTKEAPGNVEATLPGRQAHADARGDVGLQHRRRACDPLRGEPLRHQVGVAQRHRLGNGNGGAVETAGVDQAVGQHGMTPGSDAIAGAALGEPRSGGRPSFTDRSTSLMPELKGGSGHQAAAGRRAARTHRADGAGRRHPGRSCRGRCRCGCRPTRCASRRSGC